jgi:hypothetical protein
VSDLTNLEKRAFEKLLRMSSGYVLDFSNRTFDEFVVDSVGMNIYDGKYENGSGSKANRLRAFWTLEPDHLVAKLLGDLLQFVKEEGVAPGDEERFNACLQSVRRLEQSAPVPDLGAISPISNEKEFAVLARSVRQAIERNEPAEGLDRLHTFSLRYFRTLCEKRGITTEKEKPLHSLVGEYIKQLKKINAIESEMTERILKSSISTLEAFNHVRNDQSLAHDNDVLNHEESLLIYSHVCSAIRFVEALEKRLATSEQKTVPSPFDDDIPF